jgi:leader peptidase (prepilin peptidase)/N-methyltransferase
VGCALGLALLFGAGGWRWGADLRLPPHLGLFAVLLLASLIDVEHYRIPDRLTLPALVATLLVIPAVTLAQGEARPMVHAALGSLAFGGGLLVAHLASPRGMGLGDVKLATVGGAYLGWAATSVADALLLVMAGFLAASAIGTVVGLVVLTRRRRNAPFPFGPALAAGMVVALLAAERLTA